MTVRTAACLTGSATNTAGISPQESDSRILLANTLEDVWTFRLIAYRTEQRQRHYEKRYHKQPAPLIRSVRFTFLFGNLVVEKPEQCVGFLRAIFLRSDTPPCARLLAITLLFLHASDLVQASPAATSFHSVMDNLKTALFIGLTTRSRLRIVLGNPRLPSGLRRAKSLPHEPPKIALAFEFGTEPRQTGIVVAKTPPGQNRKGNSRQRA
jgi:hypothetical protein